MIASWLLGGCATLHSLANYFLSMYVQHFTRVLPRVNSVSDFCIQFCTNPPSSFVLSDAWSEELVLVHWQVVLRLLARAQPLARLQPLCELYRLAREEEALLPHQPLAFGTHCHIDRIRIDFRLARSASIQIPARENQRNLLPGAFRRPCGVPGRV